MRILGIDPGLAIVGFDITCRITNLYRIVIMH